MTTPRDQAVVNGPSGATTVTTLDNYIAGGWTASAATTFGEVRNPATDELLARVPLGGARDVDQAVQAALAAFDGWRRTPAPQRARFFFRLKPLMEQRFEDLARIVTLEHGKTLDESRGSVRRGIENVEVACGMPPLMMGYGARGHLLRHRLRRSIRQPLGVFAADRPRSTSRRWCRSGSCPTPSRTGNTFVLKPSEQVPLSQQLHLRAARTRSASRPASSTWSTAAKDVGRRHPATTRRSRASPSSARPRSRSTSTSGRAETRQARPGARRRQELRAWSCPTPRWTRPCEIVTESVYGCAGERCLAGSVVIAVGDAYDKVREGLLACGPGRQGRRRPRGRRDHGAGDLAAAPRQGPRLHREGDRRGGQADPRRPRPDRSTEHPNGYWLGPTIFDEVTPGHDHRPGGDLRPGALPHAGPRLRRGLRHRQRAPRRRTPPPSSPPAASAAREFRYRVRPGHDRRQHRRRRADGVLPVRRIQGFVLRRPEGPRPGQRRLLHRHARSSSAW